MEPPRFGPTAAPAPIASEAPSLAAPLAAGGPVSAAAVDAVPPASPGSTPTAEAAGPGDGPWLLLLLGVVLLLLVCVTLIWAASRATGAASAAAMPPLSRRAAVIGRRRSGAPAAFRHGPAPAAGGGNRRRACRRSGERLGGRVVSKGHPPSGTWRGRKYRAAVPVARDEALARVERIAVRNLGGGPLASAGAASPPRQGFGAADATGSMMPDRRVPPGGDGGGCDRFATEYVDLGRGGPPGV